MSKVIPIEERAAAELKARTLRSAPTNLSAHITLPVPVVESLVPRGEVTLVGGHGGAGKSVLGLILAAHVAAGKTWAGLTCTQGRVLIASLEDDANLVNYRLSRIADAYALDRDVIEDNITIVDGSDTDAALVSEMSEYGTARIIDMAAMEELREDADGCVLIVVDNASDAFDGNENNRRQVRGFMRRLKQVARENDAGLILLSRHIVPGEMIGGQPTLGLLDVDVIRNAFGRQVDSFEADIHAPEVASTPMDDGTVGSADSVRGVFIRAPIVENAGPNVRILARYDDKIVLVQQGNLLASAFHPELTDDTRVHRYFLDVVAGGDAASDDA